MSSALRMQLVVSLLDKLTAPARAAAQSTDKLSKALGKSQSELKHLQDAQKNLKAFDQLRIQAAQSNSAIRENQQRLAAVTREINNSTAPTKALLSQRDKLTRQAATLNTRYQQERGKMAELTRQLKDAGLGTGSLAERKQRLAGRIDEATQAVDRHKASLEKLNALQQRTRELSEYGGKLKQSGQTVAMHGAGAMAAGGAGLRGLWQLAGEGMEFDATMSRVQGLAGLEKGSEQLKMLRDQAKQLGAETMFSATDAARGQAFLAIAGFTPESIHAAMPGLLDMSLAGDIDLARTADIASNILGGFKLESSEMGRVADVLTKTFITSNTSLESLGETMKYVAPVAKKAGMSMEMTAAMAGLLGNVGIQGSQAGTSLKSMILNLSGPASVGQKALKELGVAATDSAGELRKPELILADLAKATEKMGSAKQIEYLKRIFGKEPAAAMAELMGEAGIGGLNEYIKKVEDNNAAAKKTAETFADNLVGDLDQLSSAWSGLKIDLFEEQNSGLRSLVQSLNEVLGKVAAWAKENPELVASIVKWGAIILGVVAALGALAMTIGSGMILIGGMIKMYAMVAGSIGKTIKLIGLLSKAFMLLGKFMLANPIFFAIAMLAGAAYLIYRNWDDMVGGFMALLEAFGTWWADKTAILAQDWDYLTGLISAGWDSLWGGITGMLDGIWSTITEAFNGGIGGITALLLDWSPLGIFYRILRPVLDWFGIELPGKFSEFGANIISGLVDGIKGMASKAKEAITGVGSNVTGWFKDKLGIHSPSRVFAELGGHTIDGLAVGMQAQEDGPLKRIGELGKKLTAAAGLSIPLLAGAVEPITFDSRPPLSAAATAGTPRAGDTIIINVHAAPGMDTAELARLVQQELQKAQLQKQMHNRSRLGDLD